MTRWVRGAGAAERRGDMWLEGWSLCIVLSADQRRVRVRRYRPRHLVTTWEGLVALTFVPTLLLLYWGLR